MKNTYQVHLFTIDIITPEALNIEQLKIHVPGIKYCDLNLIPNLVKQGVNNKLTIEFIKDKIGSNIEIINDTIIVKGVWSNSFKSDFPHLIYSILRQRWINKDFYPVHSICINTSSTDIATAIAHNSSCLLIGHSGSGKTTLAINALKKDLQVTSFNKSVVSISDTMKLHVGTEIISEKNSNLTSPKFNSTSSIDVKYKTSSIDVINKLYFFAIEGCELKVIPVNATSALHQLYPFFLDVVKEDVILTNNLIFEGRIESIAKLKLVNSLKSWLQFHTLEVLIGTPDDVLNYVKDNI